MASDKKMLQEAAEIAVKKNAIKHDKRTYILGAVGLRNDGVFVSSKNISSQEIITDCHAETRLVRKLTPNSTVWVARVTRKDGNWAMSKPCHGCEMRMRAAGVKRVVYTIGPGEWGVIDMTTRSKTKGGSNAKRQRK